MNHTNPFNLNVISIYWLPFRSGFEILILNILFLTFVISTIIIIAKKPSCGEFLAFGLVRSQLFLTILIANEWIYWSYSSMSGFARFLTDPGMVYGLAINSVFFLEGTIFHTLLISLCIIATMLRFHKIPSLSNMGHSRHCCCHYMHIIQSNGQMFAV
jgi:hypothetical protein